LEGSAAESGFASADLIDGRISDLPAKGYRFQPALRTKKGGLSSRLFRLGQADAADALLADVAAAVFALEPGAGLADETVAGAVAVIVAAVSIVVGI